MYIKKCEVCGKEFESKSYRAKYCSTKCGRSKERLDKMDYIMERSNRMNKSKLRERAIKTFGAKCAVCGWQATEYEIWNDQKYPSHGCEVHHIIPVSEGGDENPKNIIVLCPNCHKLAHMGLISREKLQSYVKEFFCDLDVFTFEETDYISRFLFEEANWDINSKLDNCPFCGGQVELILSNAVPDEIKPLTYCTKCGAVTMWNNKRCDTDPITFLEHYNRRIV